MRPSWKKKDWLKSRRDAATDVESEAKVIGLNIHAPYSISVLKAVTHGLMQYTINVKAYNPSLRTTAAEQNERAVLQRTSINDSIANMSSRCLDSRQERGRNRAQQWRWLHSLPHSMHLCV